MSLQYISNNSGQKTGVIIPIEAWNEIKNKYPDIETIEGDIPQWQMDEVKKRIDYYDKNPDKLVSWEEVRKRIKLG